MKAHPAPVALILSAVFTAVLAGCRSEVRVIPSPLPPGNIAPEAPGGAVTRMGYTVQVGAFSVLDNARRLAQSLNDMGLDAYYFPHASGLYRVRFGDYPSRSEAVREAGRLIEKGLIAEFFVVGPESHPFHGRSLSGTDLRVKLVATAESFVGVDYTWGGTSRRDGVDCSGLVRAVYQLNGLSLPRTTMDQFRAGTIVPRDRLREGDLVFFADSPGRPVSHVGIYVGESVFIHAPGQGQKVRQESLDGRYFKGRFSGARAFLD